MSETPKRYEIRQVADFLQVPEARRELCLSEFAMWLAITDATQQVGAALGGVVRAKTDVFSWIDDDEGVMHAHIDVHTKPLVNTP